MKYKVNVINSTFIRENGLDKVRIEDEILSLKKTLNEDRFISPGIVVAGRTGQEWKYYHATYLGEIKPCICDKIKVKNPKEKAFVIAIIEEDGNGRTDGVIGNAGYSG